MDAQNPSPTHCLEMAHVLFMDIGAYSTLPMDTQESVLGELQEAVRNTSEFARAQAEDQLIRLPTGDGMALVFFHDPEAPVRCALELSRSLRDHRGIKLRMGIHSGPVYRVADINANRNVAGGGINIAQRVMDCGDVGHILLSSAEAEVLGQLSAWCPMLHDLGEVEVKHGARVHLYNLYTEEVGKSEPPKKITAQRAALALAASHTKRRKRSLVAVVVTIILTIASVGGWLFNTHKAQALTEKDTIVLADFTNTTGDPVFDDTLKEALSEGLRQSPFLNVISDAKVRDTLKLMTRPPDVRLTSDLAREVCQRAGSKAYVAGSIAPLGHDYLVVLRAVNCTTLDSMASDHVQAASKERVVDALGKVAANLRKELGESLSSVQKFDTPLEEVTTSSLEALKAYSLGTKAFREKGDVAAIPFYTRAIELDGNFALAYAGLGRSYDNRGESDLACANLQKAYELRDRVGEREKFRISAAYHQIVEGATDQAIQAYEQWARFYPNEFAPRGNLGNSYGYLGQYEKGITQTLEALSLDSKVGGAYSNLMYFYISLDRLNEAKATYEKARGQKLDTPGLHIDRYSIAFLENDVGEMDRQLSWAADKTRMAGRFLSLQSDTEAFSGRFEKAREFSQRAVESAQSGDEKERAALWELNAALREAEVGNFKRARHMAKRALAFATTRDVQTLVALALARSGDSTRSESIARELGRRFPLNTVLNNYWLPTIHAAIEIDRGNSERAVELLRTSVPYELGTPPPEIENGSLLYPVYVRAHAYLLTHQSGEAVREFQKLLDHRSLMVNCPFAALAHLGLARAYVSQGDNVNARAAYQGFLTLWKDADPDIPILVAAKSEYAKLH
jgi:tetratricopeptide (TPR) repeat protein/class 3 adenylate cyclase